MKVTVANYGSVQAVVKFCKGQHAKSSWADLQFNPVQFKKNMAKIVREDGSDILMAKDDDDNITGILLATVDQLLFNKLIYATDMHFMCESGGILILKEFKRWAIEHGASKIIMGIANDDPTGRVHAFYAAIGMQPIGDAWVLDLYVQQEKAA